MKALPTIAWVLLGLIVIAAAFLSLDRSEAQTFPSASSYSPSGTRAFADLLQQSGYKVSLNFSDAPEVDKDDVIVAFYINHPLTFGGGDRDDEMSRLQDIVMAHVRQGGKAILFDLSDDFDESSKMASGDIVDAKSTVGNSNTTLKVNDQSEPALSGAPPAPQNPFDTDSDPTENKTQTMEGDMLTIAQDPSNNQICSALFENNGTLLEVEDGIIASNRFIDQNDNAKEAMQLIRMLAPPGAHLVFPEAVFGNISTPSILELVGNWAIAAWWQILLLFSVIIYTLGKPFGYPDQERPLQRGARDLVEAIATTYRRSRATHLSLKCIHDAADREIRRKLKLPSDTHELERNRLIPSELAMALARVKMASFTKIHPKDAAKMAADLDDQMVIFMGESVRRGKRKKVR